MQHLKYDLVQFMRFTHTHEKTDPEHSEVVTLSHTLENPPLSHSSIAFISQKHLQMRVWSFEIKIR